MRYTTSMIISTRRILLATDEPINKGEKLICPGSKIPPSISFMIFMFKPRDSGFPVQRSRLWRHSVSTPCGLSHLTSVIEP